MQKNTLISEYADKTVRAVSANYWGKSPKTHPNWNDHECHSVIGSGHTGQKSPWSRLETLILRQKCDDKRTPSYAGLGRRRVTLEVM